MPILGFDNVSKLELSEIDDIFVSARNAEDNVPAFTLINPYALREYSFDIPIAAKVLLDITSDSKLLVYNIVVLQNPIESSVVNFLAPLVFNTDTKVMGQIVLDATKYPQFGVAEKIENYLQK